MGVCRREREKYDGSKQMGRQTEGLPWMKVAMEKQAFI